MDVAAGGLSVNGIGVGPLAPPPLAPAAAAFLGRGSVEDSDVGMSPGPLGGIAALRTASGDESLMDASMDAELVATQDDELADHQLAAAIEASYAAQTESGLLTNEEDMVQQALKLSQQEEERRQRRELQEQQEAELQESILMDQMREQNERQGREDEERALAASAELERQRQEQMQREVAEKRARIPAEPPSDEPGRVDLQIRAPAGQRLRRAFRGTDLLGAVYDYLDLELVESLIGQAYCLVSTMPRREYPDRNKSLADSGLQGQCALLIELRHDA